MKSVIAYWRGLSQMGRAIVLLALGVGVAAAVLGVVLLLQGPGGHTPPTAVTEDEGPPEVLVRASYPGASAHVVAESVAGPIEQHVDGVDGMARMMSRSGNDGSYEL